MKVSICIVLVLMAFHMTKFGWEVVISVENVDHFSEIKLSGQRCVWIRMCVRQMIDSKLSN